MPPPDVHEHFRSDESVDWEGLARRQRDVLWLADKWWALLERPVGRTLADVGCGPGVLAARYAELGAQVLAVDLRAEALAHVPSHPRLRTLAHDLEASPLPRNVDILVLTDVLHHVRHRASMLKNARACSARILVAESDPEGPGDVGPPLDARLSPHEVAGLLWEAGFAPAPPVWPAPGHYAIVAAAHWDESGGQAAR